MLIAACAFGNCWTSLFGRTLQREYDQLKEQHGQRGAAAGGHWESDGSFSHPDEADLLAEAKLLRQHKGRLEARMHILEEHNKQLESQLHRLRQLLHQVTQGLRRLLEPEIMAEWRQIYVDSSIMKIFIYEKAGKLTSAMKEPLAERPAAALIYICWRLPNHREVL